MKSSVLYNPSNLVLHLKVIIYCSMYFYIPAILVNILTQNNKEIERYQLHKTQD